MKRFFFYFILIFITHLLFAQEKLLTMQEAILGSSGKLKIENMRRLQWIDNTDAYCYEDSLNGRYGLIKGNVQNDSLHMLLPLDSLNKALLNKLTDITALKHFPRFKWICAYKIRFFYKQKLFTYSFKSGKLELVNKIPKDAKNVEVEKKHFRLAFTQGQNLFISMKLNELIQVTHDTDKGISNGNNTVHRNEFGISKGIFWSPKGNELAYYHLDRRQVTEYPLVDVDTRPAQVRMIRYPMNGMTSEQVQVAIYHLKTGSITYLQTGEPRDKYLPEISWSPDEKYIYVVQLNRDQNHLQVVKYDPYSGKALQVLFEEKNPKWVEPEHGLFFVNNDPNRFLWFSKRDGYNHLYLYKSNGKLVRRLTDGHFDFTDFLRFDKRGKYAFAEAASADGLELYGYRITLFSGAMQKIAYTKGSNNILASADGKYVIDRFTNIKTPRIIAILTAKGNVQKVLLKAKNPLADYKVGTLKLLKIKNSEGLLLNARIIFPADFDSTQKYPVIVYVYGGPHGQMVTDRWLYGWPLWFQYMAERGYIIFTLDNRGTNNRGLKFEQAIFRHLGSKEVEDQMSGVKYLKLLAYVDTTRIGVHGWSFGGFMTISLLTRRPGVFKAAVAGGPVIDWRYYEVMYGERYMDTPQANPEGFKEANLLNYVKNLQGHLLIIHGLADPVVVPQNSIMYMRKAIDAGKQLDYFVYPGDQHNMRGKDRVHLYQKITDYFKLYL